MAAAYLRGPAVVAAQPAFTPGCLGKLRQSRFEASAVTAKRQRGQCYKCVSCRGWHTSSLPGPPVSRQRAPGLIQS